MHAILVLVFGWFAKLFILRLALALGIFFGTEHITSRFFEAIQAQLTNQIGSLSGVFMDAFVMSGLQQAITIIFAAYSAALSIKGLKGFGSSLTGGS